MNAVPVDDLVLGNGGWSPILPPRNIIFGDDAPWTMILAIDVSSHIAKLDVILCIDVLRWQIADIVRLAEIVPRQKLNDVGLYLIVRELLEPVGEQHVAVSDPCIKRVSIVEVFVLPRRHCCNVISHLFTSDIPYLHIPMM